MSSPRTRADACPGVLAPHDAADGALARVRLPGGVVTAAQLRVLAGSAEELGDGAVHLTSRGNLQLRGLSREDPRFEQRLRSAGLLPSSTHERVRNVLASPLSGVDGGLADVRGLARELDARLCAVPALAGLPGRFLFALDDGRGDVAAERPDLCWRATGPDQGVLLVAGEPTTVGCPVAEAPALLVAAAEVFLTLRTQEPGCGAWRASEIPDAPARIARALAGPAGGPAAADPRADGDGDDPHLGSGTVGNRPLPSSTVDHGPALVVAPVLGEVSAAQLRALAASATEVIVTPWRTVVLADPGPGAAERLHAAGLRTPDDPALRISACAGRPGCAKSHADVRGDVRDLLAAATDLPRAHVVGCERRCGAPHGPHLDVVAQPDGTYRIDDLRVPDLSALDRT
ncbi:nitrite/sulfite reductase [Pseudonocardia sp. WMMC193]|uniref:nitrite/sulfite reductase n=1 Tax=Pseudonocardia sp. WMMC193 TaxID=2911965 RepID=UPI001F48D639|nr:nitrite/sulfite reductase [Pseudonocardia sp. WMMC193]MCF7549728.1 nitrite/sulfite reductase [Pseudonocardia sp. WMMC193]